MTDRDDTDTPDADDRDRYWYVVTDDTPMLPERPLTYEQAAELFLEVVREGSDETVEITECTDEDLDWAGVDR